MNAKAIGRDLITGLIIMLAGFFFAMYAACMFSAILETPEPGWEWSLAWEKLVEVVRSWVD